MTSDDDGVCVSLISNPEQEKRKVVWLTTDIDRDYHFPLGSSIESQQSEKTSESNLGFSTLFDHSHFRAFKSKQTKIGGYNVVKRLTK